MDDASACASGIDSEIGGVTGSTGSGASISVATGAGMSDTPIATGTSAHSKYATCAPKRWRNGLRTISTSAIAKLEASVACHNSISRSAVMIEILDEALEFGDVLLGQLSAVGKVRAQWCDAASEQTIEQRGARRVDVILALEQRAVEVAPAVALGGDRALLEQAIEQRLDGGFLPVGGLGQFGHHVIRRRRVLLPQHFHHQAFRIADCHRLTIYGCN